jgi:hypothetical protein
MMKIKILGIAAIAMLALVLAFTLAAPAAPTGPAKIAGTATAAPGTHPEIRDAIAALRRARDHMEHAKHDFGGHRVEAIRATDDAIRQLEIGLKYD